MSLILTPPETDTTVVPSMHLSRSNLPALFVLVVLMTTTLYGCNFDAEPDYQVKAMAIPAIADSDSDNEKINNPSSSATAR